MSESLKRYRYGLAGTVCMFEDAMGGWIRYCDHVEELNRRQEAKPLTQSERNDLVDLIDGLQDDHGFCSPEVLAECILTKYAMPPDQSARIAELESFIETCTVLDQECQSRIDLAVGEALKRNDQSDRIKELEHERDTAVFKLETIEHQRDKLQFHRDRLLEFVKKVEQYHGPYTLAGCKAGELHADAEKLIREIEGGQ